jgi:hypothetical protein
MLACFVDRNCEAKVFEHHELKTFICEQEKTPEGDSGAGQENICLS